MTFFGQTPAEPTEMTLRNWTYTSADDPRELREQLQALRAAMSAYPGIQEMLAEAWNAGREAEFARAVLCLPRQANPYRPTDAA